MTQTELGSFSNGNDDVTDQSEEDRPFDPETPERDERKSCDHCGAITRTWSWVYPYYIVVCESCSPSSAEDARDQYYTIAS